ncbi:hypothetical protein AB0B94_31225 [Micromonospora sp. NPDC048986]|uniref:hypothetical protein n=1 Tax=Micromonospora sp. NPDC048986 TaxID=3155644 RepID=UPI0033DFA374
MSEDPAQQYRPVKNTEGVCTVCDEAHPLTNRHSQPAVTNRHGVTHKRFLLRVHGPRNNRCPGSHTEPKPWLEASGLPAWDAMTDLDRGAALMHVHKRRREGASYAREHYPVRYSDHPLLIILVAEDIRTACRHAAIVAGNVADGLTDDEYGRLYDLALDYKPGKPISKES